MWGGISCIVILICISLMFKWCWISFHMWAYVDTFFGEMSIQILCPFLIRLFGFLLLSCSFLCILLINSLSDVYFTNKFSLSISLSFHSVDRVLWCTKVLNFDEDFYVFFSFIACAFRYHIQEVIVKLNVTKIFFLIYIFYLFYLLHWVSVTACGI